MARDMGPGHTLVTVLCDAGQRYASKIYDPAFLNTRGLPTPNWMS
jgi:cysteine synthase A